MKETVSAEEVDDVLLMLHREIAENAKRHSEAIRRDHERSMKSMHRRHDFGLLPILTSFAAFVDFKPAHPIAVLRATSSPVRGFRGKRFANTLREETRRVEKYSQGEQNESRC